MPGYDWQAMYLSPEMERDFIKLDLGPALKESNNSNVALMVLDDQRFLLPKWVDPVSAGCMRIIQQSISLQKVQNI